MSKFTKLHSFLNQTTNIHVNFANVLWVAFSIPSDSLSLVKYPVLLLFSYLFCFPFLYDFLFDPQHQNKSLLSLSAATNFYLLPLYSVCRIYSSFFHFPFASFFFLKFQDFTPNIFCCPLSESLFL
jgi:hypothetical protein